MQISKICNPKRKRPPRKGSRFCFSSNARSQSATMSIRRQPAPVNTAGGGGHEREFLTRAINTAIARAITNTLEAIAAAFRRSTVAEIQDWLRDEGLDQNVQRHMRGVS